MTEPIQFADNSARFGLPFLRPGQAQKEFFVNQAVVLSDFLHHTSVLGTAVAPPPTPSDGDLWIVAVGATGDWAGRSNYLAGWHSGSWHFIVPLQGMRVFDQAAAQIACFGTEWRRPIAPPNAAGGAVVDTELRAAFAALLETLAVAGVFPVTQ